MNKIVAAGPNTDQIEYWNGLAGDRWVQLQKELDAMISAVGRDAMARAEIAEGERVVDIGCGCGETTLEIARRVGPSGAVTGIDISAPMVEHARSRAAEDGLANARFENADAETHKLMEEGVDLLFSRFGVMFFDDPTVAFKNLASTLRPGGRMTFVCWRAPDENPWLLIPSKAAGAHLELSPRPGPEDPSPFAFANPDRVTGILTGAGFTDIALERRDGPLLLGGPNTLDGAVRFSLNIGPASIPCANADAATVEKVVESVRGALEPYYTGSAVELPSSAWIVTARKP
jgi:SAM-dependent methyltransferase